MTIQCEAVHEGFGGEAPVLLACMMQGIAARATSMLLLWGSATDLMGAPHKSQSGAAMKRTIIEWRCQCHAAQCAQQHEPE